MTTTTTTSDGTPTADHEDRAKEFVHRWTAHILSLASLPGPELQSRIFEDRAKLINDLRWLLQDARNQGYKDAQKATRERLEHFMKTSI